MTKDGDSIATSDEADDTSPRRPKERPKIIRYLVFFVVVLGAVAAIGIFDRHNSDEDLNKWTQARAIPTVNLVSPKHATESENLTLPADVEAFYTAPIHSRVNGYVKMWYFDIGARVKTGDVLARIDTPDLDQQYEQVKGELSKSEADYKLAELTATRWQALRASSAVSQQTADEKVGDAAARKAQVGAAQANVDRVKAMLDFKNILAPFDGVVTSRRIDVGALVSATNTSENALFDVASVDKMRVYISVPQVYAASMRKDLKVTLTLPQYPGRSFVGAIDTTSNSISAKSRALLVEAIFDNADGLLTPGAYAEAHFHLPLDPHKLVVPSSALLFRNLEPEVAVVKDNKITLKAIKILVDTGPQIEIGSGLEIDDKVVQSPSDSMENGEEVKVEAIDGKKVKGGAPSTPTSPPASKDANAAEPAGK